MRSQPGWLRSCDKGSAEALHGRAAAAVAPGGEPLTRSVRVLEATGRAVVLGSTQDPAVVDDQRLEAAGMAVTRRRSGGAAVVVGPGEAEWVDVVVPAGDELWDRDVGRSAWWIGDLWAAALRAVGMGDVEAWRGPLRRSQWSPLVCFAGLGAGEVTVAGRKVVGVSQRRTAAGTLLQSAVLVRWAPEELLDVLALDDVARRAGAATLAGVASGIGAAAGAAVEAFVAGLAPGCP